MEHKTCPSRFPFQDLQALITNPLLLDERFPTFAGRTVSSAWQRTMHDRSVTLLEQLVHDPSPLLDWVAHRPSHRLGYYFEQLFLFWLSHLGPITSLHGHRPVVENHRTLGELDILGFDQDTGEGFHFELAIKFYLQVAKDRVEPCDFVGPKAQDRLDIKLDRLFQKQLRLLETEAGRRAIPRELQNVPILSQAFVQGGLFYPLEVWLGSEAPRVPAGLMSTAPIGWWIRMDQVPPRDWSQLPADQWSDLPRLEWLSRQNRDRDDPDLQDAEHFWDISRRKIQETGRAILAVGYVRAGAHGGWLEVTRGFLLPETWPQTMATDRDKS
ncbi:MAG TPA: DUF1853 family protein [Oligoflexus sp.]|uniref:DUF1853 family protein n=1 Tax=Oligoflexus sp. TaxID=1971216 RepID=UPI002D306DCC|nr:DUF1853 family protein [Oligoflexus sp.]HYX32910.1 DUF1853 family protein [Oligoflexus sp.]